MSTYTIVQPASIYEPWCGQGTSGTDFLTPPVSGGSTVSSQDNGWGTIFSTSLPPDGSGLPILRKQMNGALNLYSSHIAWLQGGGWYTYDINVSGAVGGYPAGQILWCAFNKSWQISLVNNNTANFVANHAYINDGVNWQQITLSPHDLDNDIFPASFTTLNTSGAANVESLGVGTNANINGDVNIGNDLSVGVSGTIAGNLIMTAANFPRTAASNGKVSINGIIIQWFSGVITSNAGTQNIFFPTPFPTNVFSVTGNLGYLLTPGQSFTLGTEVADLSTFNTTLVGTDSGTHTCNFIAIGN